MIMELKKIVEALLFAADRPLTTKDIRQMCAEAVDEDKTGVVEPFRNVREASIVAALEELKAGYELQQCSFHLAEIAGGWRLMSRPEFAPWLKKLLDEARPYRLSQPALETLSIIALRQPISRADIAGIRGVEVDGVIKSLLERDLITITGRSDAPGKPLLYGTTQKFLEHFGLNNLDDMPKAAELRVQAAALKTAESKPAPSAPAAETPAAAPDAPVAESAAPAASADAGPTPEEAAPNTESAESAPTVSNSPAGQEEQKES